MATAQVKTGRSLPGVGADTLITPRSTLDGATFDQSWLGKLALEGRMFTVQVGTGTSPATFKAAYVNTTPDVDISVPAGVMAIPVFYQVYFEAFGSNSIAEVSAAIGTGGAQGSGTAQTPLNHRIDLADTSGVTALSACTGATYMTTRVLELPRNGQQTAITKTGASATASASDPNLFQWSATQSGFWPIMYSPSAASRFNLFAASQAGTGFITVTFVVPDISGPVGN